MNLRTLLAFLLLAVPAAAMQPGPGRRSVAGVPPQIESAERVGRADPVQPMDRMILVLPSKDPEGRARLLREQQTAGSPDYHRWLSPGEYTARFGAKPEDVAAVEAWLAEQGFTVEPGRPGRTAIIFSGTVGQVEAAFATRMGLYAKGGEPKLANELPATLPAAIASRVVGIVSLHGFSRKAPLSHPAPLGNDLFGYGSHYLAAGDFAKIYGTRALLDAGKDGTGTTIAIIGRTRVDLSDAQRFRSYMGLPSNDPQIVVNGPDPGIVTVTGSDPRAELEEANLDIQWAGAVAPNAHVVLVASKSTDTTDGVDLSIEYAITQNLGDVVSVSFGACEHDLGADGMAFYENMWAQAAAQGQTGFVASGDTGVAGCYVSDTSYTLGANGLATSPNTVCVGGSQFDDAASPSSYWTAEDSTHTSALGYIPETTWDSGNMGSGGGVSITYAQPTWQAAFAVPSPSFRSVPDVAFPAAGHTPYLVSDNARWVGMYGTSAASPSAAGIGALLVQKTGGRMGALNPVLYAIGQAQYAGSGPAVFHDITTGNNGSYGVPGYSAGTGYDLSTGLGSFDASALAQAYPSYATPSGFDFFADATPGALAIAPGKSDVATLRLWSETAGDLVAAVNVSGLPSGVSASMGPSQISSFGTLGYASVGVPVRITFSVASSAANGTYPVDFTAAAGGRSRTVRIYLTVSTSGPGFPPAPGTEVQVPVVLDVVGALGSHYTSDLSAVNRSDADVTAQVRFSGNGAAGPIVSLSLPARRELYVRDVVAFLTENGWSFPGARLGTLFLTFTGVSDPSLVFAGSRITTPNADKTVGGAYGTFAAALASGTASTSEAWVYGLERSASFRSNLAVVHAPGGSSSLSGGGPINVEVQLFDGATGAPAGGPVVNTLQPGDFWQIDAFTNADASVATAYARVRRTSGSDRFITYGVVNDGGSAGVGTSDGSLIVSGGTDGLVPIVLDIPGSTHYQTEISLTNTAPTPVDVQLVYTSATALGGTAWSSTASVGLAAGQQIQRTNALDWLRGLGMPIPTSGAQGGTLRVTGAVAVARTWNPAAAGGTYGVSYPALDAAHRATTSAWVYGLRQDADVRSNLAVADARVGDSSTRDYAVDLYDADSGSATPVTTITVTLGGGQWTQLNSVLFGAGITHGYAHVRTASGTSDFLAYGVVNDGPTSGSRTSDGSYVPMVVSN